MAVRPHRLLEQFAGALLPTGRKEDVLGDLCERYTSPAGYLCDAVQIVPVVIASHALRQLRGAAPSARAVAQRPRPEGLRGAVRIATWLASSGQATTFPVRGLLFFGAWYIVFSVDRAFAGLKRTLRRAETGPD